MRGERDVKLDVAKGMAIILVVIGHTFQGQSADFDHNLGFRIIYSFHMPLFIALSGAVASLRLPPLAQDWGIGAGRAIKRALIRLGLPFLAWTVIGYSGHRDVGMGQWLLMVAKSVDYSLWFLVAVLYCLILWHVWQLLVGTLRRAVAVGRFPLLDAVLNNRALLLVISVLAYRPLLHSVPGTFGLAFAKMYYFYFVAGALFQLYGQKYLQGVVRVLPYVVFALLVPFWYRLEPVTSVLWGTRVRWVDDNYQTVVALAGSLVIIDLVRMVCATGLTVVIRFLAYCGTASLGVYAFHFHLLPYPPAVIAPLVLSLAAYWAVSKLPVVRVVLLGEHSPRARS